GRDTGKAAGLRRFDTGGGPHFRRQTIVGRSHHQEVLVEEGHDAHDLLAQARAHHREISQALAGRCGDQAFDPDWDLFGLAGWRHAYRDTDGVFFQIWLGGVAHGDHARTHSFG